MLMPKVISPSDSSFNNDPIEEMKEHFVLQDEQEIPQFMVKELDALIIEPSKMTIEKILSHARMLLKI
jgi:hypothetical protein